MTDLRERAPGHSLIEKLLSLWENGSIRYDPSTDQVTIDDDAVSWYAGVHGERHVARILESLGPEFIVLHSVPIGTGGRDLDHLVIGPTGVFTINTKNSAGKPVWAAGFGVYVGRYPQKSYVRAALGENETVAKTLSQAAGFAVPVTSLLVFVQPEKVTIKDRVGDGKADIRVIPDDRLLHIISGRQLLDAEQVRSLIEAARVPTTWLRVPAASQPGIKIALEFDALDDAIGSQIANRIAQQPSRPAPYSVVGHRPQPAPHGRSASTTRTPPSPRPARPHSRPVRRSRQPRGRGLARAILTPLARLAGAAVGALVIFWFIANVGPLVFTSFLERMTQP